MDVPGKSATAPEDYLNQGRKLAYVWVAVFQQGTYDKFSKFGESVAVPPRCTEVPRNIFSSMREHLDKLIQYCPCVASLEAICSASHRALGWRADPDSVCESVLQVLLEVTNSPEKEVDAVGDSSTLDSASETVAMKCCFIRVDLYSRSDTVPCIGSKEIMKVISADKSSLSHPYSIFGSLMARGLSVAPDSLLHHLSCNWGRYGQVPSSAGVGCQCQVAGCEIHPAIGTSQKNNRQQFNIVSIYNSVEPEPDPCMSSDAILENDGRDAGHFNILPTDVIPVIFSYLQSAHMARMRQTCKYFRFCVDMNFFKLIPNLLCTLFPHQIQSLRFMLSREAVGITWPSPLAKSMVASDGTPYYFAYVTRNGDGETIELCKGSPKIFPVGRGGLLCDEPGLGKTVACLSLVLCTRGQWTSPPKDAISRDAEQGSYVYDRFSSKDRAEHQRNARVFGEGSLGEGSRITTVRRGTRSRVPIVETVYTSKTTLIVCPDVLVDHWCAQVETHVEEGALSIFTYSRRNPLPDPEQLRHYDVVIAPLSLINTMVIPERLRCRRPDWFGREESDRTPKSQSGILLQVHFRRLIVDEGHQIRGSTTSVRAEILSMVLSDCRWVITGTPTPDTPNSDIDNIFALLEFVQHEPWSLRRVWQCLVSYPYENERGRALLNLRTLLMRVMIRHTKAKTELSIPPVAEETHRVLFHAGEENTYNMLVSMIKRNLLLTGGIVGDDASDTKEGSLLHPSNRSEAQMAVNNVLMACSVKGDVQLQLSQNEELRVRIRYNDILGIEEGKLDVLFQDVRDRQPKYCRICGVHLFMVLITPCAHIILTCPDCLQRDDLGSSWPNCEVCGKSVMIPSKGKHDRKGRMLHTFDEFIRLQLGYEMTQVNWRTVGGYGLVRGRHRGRLDLAAVTSPKISFMLLRLKEILENPTRRIVIYARFTYHVDLIIGWLETEEIEYAIMTRTIKLRDVANEYQRFRHLEGENCRVVVIDDMMSHGIDLSNATNIIMMDQVLDYSLERQIISRAHRMGATQAIKVDKLIIRGTVEDKIHSIVAEARQSGGSAGLKRSFELSKRKEILLSLPYARETYYDPSHHETPRLPNEIQQMAVDDSRVGPRGMTVDIGTENATYVVQIMPRDDLYESEVIVRVAVPQATSADEPMVEGSETNLKMLVAQKYYADVKLPARIVDESVWAMFDESANEVVIRATVYGRHFRNDGEREGRGSNEGSSSGSDISGTENPSSKRLRVTFDVSS